MGVRLLITALVIAGMLGGCVGQSAPSGGRATDRNGTEEPPSSITVTAAPGIVTAINKGVVIGSVIDDAEVLVPGARVAILPTDFFVDTGADGRFRFENVTPGSYVLRTEASAYRADEQEIEVLAGNVTNVTVRLLPLEDRGAGYRPHKHDLWGGQTEVVLLETQLEYTGPISQGNENPYVDRVLGAVYYSNQPSPSNSWCRIPFKDMGDGPEIVLPGTKEIRVTITWQNPQGSTLEKMGLGYSTAINSNIVHLPKQPPGQPFIIPVKPEEADSGHQRFSLWNFYLEPQNTAANAPNDKPAVSLGTFQVSIVLIKGDEVPVDEAHEDWWGGNATRVLRARDPATSAAVNGRPTLRLPSGSIVPPGTAKLRVILWWAYTDAANGTAADREYMLLWRTANMPPQMPPAQFVTRPPAFSGPYMKVYEIPVAGSETDGFYQRLSTWAFYPSVPGYEKEWFNPDPRGRSFRLHVEAIRDPSFE